MKGRPVDTAATVSSIFTIESLRALLEERTGPCVSVYFPAHRRPAEARSDSILYRNLCRKVEKMLERDAEPLAAREITGKLRALDEPEFWKHGSEGVAVFAAPGFFAAYRLPMEVPALEVVGGSFHTKPMIRYLQNEVSYHLLVVRLEGVKLFEGWGETLQAMELDGAPLSFEQFAPRPEPGEGKRARQRGEDKLHHGQGGEVADGRGEIDKFFREVGRAAGRILARNAHKPVILAIRPQHLSRFRRAADVPGLVDETVAVSSGELSLDALAREARRILAPEVARRIERAREEFAVASTRGLASDRMGDIARAVVEGRVKQLCVESGRRYWGLLDRDSGSILPGENHKNGHDVDLYDELAEMTLSQGGEVLVLPKDKIPSATGIAATYRY